MRIELERLIYPEAAEEVECALCERPFTLGLVVARALTDSRVDAGEVCPECASWMSRGPMAVSGKFPTEEDYARREREWGTPEFASAAAFDALYWEDLGRRQAKPERSENR